MRPVAGPRAPATKAGYHGAQTPISTTDTSRMWVWSLPARRCRWPALHCCSVVPAGFLRTPLSRWACTQLPARRTAVRWRRGARGAFAWHRPGLLAGKHLSVGLAAWWLFSAPGASRGEVALEAVQYARAASSSERLTSRRQIWCSRWWRFVMALVRNSRLLYRAADARWTGARCRAVLLDSQKRHAATDAVLRVAGCRCRCTARFSRSFRVERYYRDARHLSIAEGTNQIQSNSLRCRRPRLSTLR